MVGYIRCYKQIVEYIKFFFFFGFCDRKGVNYLEWKISLFFVECVKVLVVQLFKRRRVVYIYDEDDDEELKILVYGGDINVCNDILVFIDGFKSVKVFYDIFIKVK